nr:DNA helicase [Tanacetum cinerariifolium]
MSSLVLAGLIAVSPGCDVPSVGPLLASCYSRITGLYVDVFRKCSEFCCVKSQRECMINRTEDAQLYLDVYRKYYWVSRKIPCVQQGTTLRGSSPFVGGVGDGLDKCRLQPSRHFDVFEAYLALCSSGAGVSNNGSFVSRQGRNMQVRPRVNSSVGVRSASRKTSRRVLTSGSTADTNSIASPGTSDTYRDLGDCDRRCRYCGASFWGYELPTSNALGAMVFKNVISYNADFDVIIQHSDGPPQKKKHNDIRSDYLSGLYDAISQGERAGYKVGGRIILPMSFTGGSRHIADVVCRVFEQKIQALIAFHKEERIIRDVTGDPEGYNVVSELMMHGPCEAISLKAPCIKGDKCSKKFPKKFNQKTFFDENDHVYHQRRDITVSATRNEFQLDNSYVVPYNRNMLLAFRAHINVKYCGWKLHAKHWVYSVTTRNGRLHLRKRMGASKIDVISSCISKSTLWPSFKVFTLKHNMKLARPNISLEERSLVNSSVSWLLVVGDEKISELADEDPENTCWVHIPPAYCLTPDE